MQICNSQTISKENPNSTRCRWPRRRRSAPRRSARSAVASPVSTPICLRYCCQVHYAARSSRLHRAAESRSLKSVEQLKMYLKVKLTWNVVIAAENLDAQGLLLQRAILVRLLEDFATKKATKDLGYLLAVTTVDKIGEGKVRPQTGDVLFPVNFTCLTFRFFRGEVVEGVVTKILKHGVFLSCGPVETVFLSSKKMPGYEHVPGENQMFVSEKRAKLEKGALVRFTLMDSKWVESERVFMALGSLDGDYLGPV